MEDSSLYELFEHIFSSVNFDGDFDDIIDTLAEQGVDLTQYSTSEIEEALKYAMQGDGSSVIDSHDTAISFGSATSYQDSCYTDFKDWLEYHCHIHNYEIPYKGELVTSDGDYSRSVISKLETWVRDLYDNDRITSFDRDQLFNKLSGMKS